MPFDATNLHLDIYSTDILPHIWNDICADFCCSIVCNSKRLEPHLYRRQFNKLWSNHGMEYYAAIRKNEEVFTYIYLYGKILKI